MKIWQISLIPGFFLVFLIVVLLIAGGGKAENETNENETSEPYLEVSGMDEDHYNGSYVVSNQTFGGRPILVHENENADTTYIFYHSEREEWIIQPVEPSDEWNAHMIGKGDVWDPAEAIWDNDNYTMVLEWIGINRSLGCGGCSGLVALF